MIRIFAPAKVNLTLHITSRRDNGYHELDSLVVFVGVGDTLTVEPAADITLTVTGPQAANLSSLTAGGDENIVLKAARALAAEVSPTSGAALTLHKVLPIASGIGGGSTDAAAALRALQRLWKTPLPKSRLLPLATALGADVPVCLSAVPARMTGIGEVLHDAPDLPASWLVLCNVGQSLSTPAVFRARHGDFAPAPPLPAAFRDADSLAQTLAEQRNDLTEAARSLVPAIGDSLAALAALPGCLLARMSGSGATCWGLFATEYDAQRGQRALAAAHPQWWSAVAPVLPPDADCFALADDPAVAQVRSCRC